MRRLRLHLPAGYRVVLFIAVTLAASIPSATVAASVSASEGMFNESTASYEPYLIATGDVVSIMVWGHEQFSLECQVNGAGTISYPLLGDVQASGLTCRELQAQLEKGLQKYLKRPQILVKVLHYGQAGTSVFVIGEVNAPGAYPLSGNMGLMQTLAAAGGATSRASGEVTIVKARTGEICTVGMEQALVGPQSPRAANIQPGDVVVVNRKPEADRQRRYTILGEVPRPGIYDISADREVSVLDAMEKAGILTNGSESPAASPAAAMDGACATADLEHALLTRGEVVVPLNLVALLQGDTSQNLLLQESDILTIPRRSLISVYALGEVRTPGKQYLPTQSTVMNLLNAAGGVTASANLGQATVLRVVAGRPRSIHLDLGALLRRADAEQNVVLEEGDVLFVPGRGETRNDLLRVLPVISYLLH